MTVWELARFVVDHDEHAWIAGTHGSWRHPKGPILRFHPSQVQSSTLVQGYLLGSWKVFAMLPTTTPTLAALKNAFDLDRAWSLMISLHREFLTKAPPGEWRMEWQQHFTLHAPHSNTYTVPVPLQEKLLEHRDLLLPQPLPGKQDLAYFSANHLRLHVPSTHHARLQALQQLEERFL